MYRDHCRDCISPAMQADAVAFRRGVMFAICSIRQPTINVPGQLETLFDPQDGEESPLFGHKFQAWAYISEESNNARLWRRLGDLHKLSLRTPGRANRMNLAVEAIAALLEVPGLGIVKAAFIAQLFGFNVACLDARNITREGRDPRAFRTDGKTPDKLRPKIVAYVSETFGKSERYWDLWCKDVAAAYDRTPQEISELHLAIVPSDYVPF